MAIVPLVGVGGFFSRFGVYAGFINRMNNVLGSSSGVLDYANYIDAQFQSNHPEISGAWYSNVAQGQAALDTIKGQAATSMATVATAMANDSIPQSSANLAAAISLIITQMQTATKSLSKNTVTATPTAGTANGGTGKCFTHVKGPGGINREYCLAETVTMTCTTDALSGGATAGQETWQVVGVAAETNQLAWDWPLGSGASITDTSIIAAGSRNVLNNSNFETWPTSGTTAVQNTPTGWTVVVGTAGTQILKSSAVKFRSSSYSLEFVGDASTLHKIKQQFNSSSGTTSLLLPLKVYACSFWYAVTTGTLAGTLKVSLQDSAGTVVLDNQGTANSVTQTLSGGPTTFTQIQTFFRTPTVMTTYTAPFYLVVEMTVAQTNAKNLYIDELTLAIPTELYKGGPWLAVYPGATDYAVGDTQSVVVTNDWAGRLQTKAQQFFDMRTLGLQFPTSSSGTVSDSLIVTP